MRTLFSRAGSLSRSLFTLACAASIGLWGCGGDVTGGGGGSGGGGGGDACEPFLTNPPTKDVTVRITNNTLADLYIGPEQPIGCGQADQFTLEGADGATVVWRLPPCALTCEDVHTGACACAADCALPVIWRIAPQGTLEVPWSGLVYPVETMPASCQDPSCMSAEETCFVPNEATGALVFRAKAFSDVSGTCAGGCTCTPDAGGTCTIDASDALVSGIPVITSTEVDALGALVEITFEGA